MGDTQYDILAGKDNGAYTIAVENGFYKADFFKEFKPDVIFEDFSDTDKVIEAILS